MKITDILKERLNNDSKITSKDHQHSSTERQKFDSAGEDTVSISPLARQFTQVSKILSDDEAERQLKLDEIKRAIEDGSYLDSISTTDVAESIVAYSRDVDSN
jgi:flagellar biosynthesis anti-sigma factor FlgM